MQTPSAIRRPLAGSTRILAGFDVLVDEASLMHAAERARERDRDAQEMRYLQWSAKQSTERRTAGILKHQRQAVVVVRQRDWPAPPSQRQVRALSAYSCSSRLNATERAFFRGNKQDRRQAVAGAPVESDVSSRSGENT